MLAMIGAKKIEIKKKKPQKTAVMPVFAPASTPAPLSMKDVTGLSPKSDPNIVDKASAAKARRLFGKSPVSLSTYPRAEASARRVPLMKEGEPKFRA
jgi:hypothetical protein